MVDLAELAFAGWQTEEERTRQKNVVLAGQYYAGEQHVPLTARQREFLGFKDGGRFALNFCRAVVDSVCERMLLAVVTSEDAVFAALAWRWWEGNRMDEKQSLVHRGAVRDGEYFVIVDLDANFQPRFTPHPRYTDPQVGGTGFGCKAHYLHDMPMLPLEFVSKRWTETVTLENGKRETRQRLTEYCPGEIRKYRMAAGSGEAGWVRHSDEGDVAWPLAWVDGRGQPLGITVIHFRNPDSTSELWDAIPPQDGINKTALDILAVADAAGFPIRVARGFRTTTDGLPPASDGGNQLALTPGCWLEIPKDGDAFNLPVAELTGLLATLDSWIIKLAQITSTPTSRFQLTRQVAAEGTLKQQEAVALVKVRERQTRFGNSWEDMFYMARRLANLHGAELNEESLLETQWQPAATRDVKEHIETLSLKHEKLEIPLETIWGEAGYSPEQIAKMMLTAEYQARLGRRQQVAALYGEADDQS
jgi:hypothetical protein